MADPSRTRVLPVSACSKCGAEFLPPAPTITVCADCVRRGDEAAAGPRFRRLADWKWALWVCGSLAVILAILVIWVSWAFHSDADGRTPMLLSRFFESDKTLFSEVECYLDDRGEPVWHGHAKMYRPDGKCFIDLFFLDGRFTHGWRDWGNGRIWMKDMLSVYEAKRLINGHGYDTVHLMNERDRVRSK